MSARGDAISDNNANDPASRHATPAGLHWGDADVPVEHPDRTSASGERDVKGVFGVPKPPPPAGASLAGAPNADPLASLFATDTIVKAPGIHDAPSEAELGRWRATMQSSLFEERVLDPAPPRVSVPDAPPALVEPESAPPAAPSRVAAPAAVVPPPPAPQARAPVREGPPREVADAPPRQAAPRPAPEPEEPQRPAEKARGTKSTGRRRRAAAEAAVPAPEVEAAPAPAARRRVERGPSKGLLAALGIAVASAIAALVIVLGPSGGASVEGTVVTPAPQAAAPPAPVAASAAPVAAVPGQAKAAAVPAPAANKPASAAPAAAPQAPEAPAAPAKAAVPVKAAAAPTAEAEAGDEEAAGAPESLLRAGRQALAADDAPAAERIARDALAQAPQDHHAMELLVQALMDQDRGAEALPYARRMVKKRSRRVPYRLLLGDLLLMVGDETAARAEWQKALALSPGDKAIKRRLGL